MRNKPTKEGKANLLGAFGSVGGFLAGAVSLSLGNGTGSSPTSPANNANAEPLVARRREEKEGGEAGDPTNNEPGFFDRASDWISNTVDSVAEFPGKIRDKVVDSIKERLFPNIQIPTNFSQLENLLSPNNLFSGVNLGNWFGSFNAEAPSGPGNLLKKFNLAEGLRNIFTSDNGNAGTRNTKENKDNSDEVKSRNPKIDKVDALQREKNANGELVFSKKQIDELLKSDQPLTLNGEVFNKKIINGEEFFVMERDGHLQAISFRPDGKISETLFEKKWYSKDYKQLDYTKIFTADGYQVRESKIGKIIQDLDSLNRDQFDKIIKDKEGNQISLKLSIQDYESKSFGELKSTDRLNLLKSDSDSIDLKVEELKKLQTDKGLSKKSSEYKELDAIIKKLEVISGKIKFQQLLLSDKKLELQKGDDGKIKPESLLGEGRIVMDPKDLKEMLTSGYFTQDKDHMGKIMASIQENIMKEDPFPIDRLEIAEGTKFEGVILEKSKTLRAPDDLKKIKELVGLESFAVDAASGICYAFVNYTLQKANGIEIRSFKQWYVDNVKAGRIGYGETQGGIKGIFQGTGDVIPYVNKTGTNYSENNINFGTYNEPIRNESNLVRIKLGIENLKNSSSNFAVLHVHNKKTIEGDHFLTIIRNPETNKWEPVDHNGTGGGWKKGEDIFAKDDIMKDVRRISYVE